VRLSKPMKKWSYYILVLAFVVSGATCTGTELFSKTAIINVFFSMMQELSIFTTYPSSIIQVGKGDGNSQVRSTIFLDAVDLSSGSVELPRAVKLCVLSTTDWKVLVSVAALEIERIEEGMSSIITVFIQTADIPEGVAGVQTFVPVIPERWTKIAEGVPFQTCFSVNYLLRLRPERTQMLKYREVELIYVLWGM